MNKFQINKLSDVCQIESGGTPSSSDASYWDGDIPWVTLVDVKNKYVESTIRKISLSGLKNSSAKILPVGTVLFSSRATIGNVSITKIELATNQGFKNFICDKDKIIPEYLYYFLKKEAVHIEESCPGTTYKEISKSKIGQYVIPLPPLEVQKRILKILAQTDALRQKRKQAIDLLDNYLKSVFLEMFGEPVKNLKGWEAKNTSEIIIGKAQNGFFAKNEQYGESGTPVIWITDFINLPYAKVENLKRVAASRNDNQKYKVAYGDVLFCRSSLTFEGIGRCSIISPEVFEDTIYECHIIKITLDKETILPEYFREFSKTAFFRNQVIRRSKTSTMTTISQEGILSTTVLVPPITIQKAFLRITQKVETLKQKMLAQSEEMENQFQALMQKAFKGAL